MRIACGFPSDGNKTWSTTIRCLSGLKPHSNYFDVHTTTSVRKYSETFDKRRPVVDRCNGKLDGALERIYMLYLQNTYTQQHKIVCEFGPSERCGSCENDCYACCFVISFLSLWFLPEWNRETVRWGKWGIDKLLMKNVINQESTCRSYACFYVCLHVHI